MSLVCLEDYAFWSIFGLAIFTGAMGLFAAILALAPAGSFACFRRRNVSHRGELSPLASAPPANEMPPPYEEALEMTTTAVVATRMSLYNPV